MSFTGLLLQVAAAAAAQGAPATGPGPWILTCDMASSAGSQPAYAQRVFRLGPKLFQEWKPAERAFGYNLCDSFPCRSDRNRLEAEIRSSTLVLTVSYDPQSRAASWRTQGASGLTRPNGTCAVRADTPAAKPR